MAKFELLMPKMGESVDEATIINWLKNVGDKINEDDLIVEIATDKVDSEVPSEVSSTQRKALEYKYKYICLIAQKTYNHVVLKIRLYI